MGAILNRFKSIVNERSCPSTAGILNRFKSNINARSVLKGGSVELCAIWSRAGRSAAPACGQCAFSGGLPPLAKSHVLGIVVDDAFDWHATGIFIGALLLQSLDLRSLATEMAARWTR